jgi:F-box and WD-40 domain protein CDC4
LSFTSTTTAVSASRDTLLKIWDLEAATCQGTLSGHGDSILDLAIVGEFAVSASKDGTAKVWNLRQQRNVSTLSGHTGSIYRVICHSDGVREKVYTGSIDHDLRVWDLISGENLAVLKGHKSLVTHIHTSSCVDGDVLVTGAADGNIIIWSLQDHSILHMVSKAHEGAVTSLDVRDGHILSGGSDGAIKVWDLETGTLLGQVGLATQAVWSVSFGRGASQSHTAIVSSAQGSPSLVEGYHDAVLDVSG